MTKILNETRQHGVLFSTTGKGRDEFEIPTPPGEVFHSCRLTILETHLGGAAKIVAQPMLKEAGDLAVVIEWNCKGMGMVKYQLEVFITPEAASPMAGKESVTWQPTRFLPSVNGFHFDNQFESVPSFKLIGDLRYGDASKGLCGGMVYGTLDYFNSGLNIPSIPNKDLSLRFGSPLHGTIFDYLGKRLFNSFDVPNGVWAFIKLMQPNFPDFQGRNDKQGLDPRSRAWHMVREEWPIIKTKLDSGQPCPLGLICVKSSELARLGDNHQVLAYGYDLLGDDLSISIYDPNYHDDDTITLSLNIADPEHETPVTYSKPSPVYCFFHTNYLLSKVPTKSAIPGRIILFEDENFCGRSIDVVHANSDLSTLKEGNFDDRTSSFVILSGNWSFYRKPGFEAQCRHGRGPLILGPGTYERVVDLGIQDNAISSLQEVSNPASK
jgi:hypothetical protein